ncbi:MAG: DUF1961 family protein [Sedimentisphaeraceae bacterium JB056]
MLKYSKILTAIIVISTFSGLTCAHTIIDGFDKVLIYENTFDNFDQIDDWVMEGPGKKYLSGNQMMLIPDAQQYVYRKWEQCDRKILDARTEYYAAVREGLAEVNPSMIEKVSNDKGQIVGGHIVCWNKAFETADDYVIEYDFKPMSPIGLGIIFFSAKGINGEDVLSPKLKPRSGVFMQYLKSDLDSYHISYWANNAAIGKRGTCNLRKNAGFFCLANGDDPSVKNLDYSNETFDFETYKVTLIKLKNRIVFAINDEIAIDYTDNRYNDIMAEEGVDIIKEKNVDTGKVHGAGRIGLRQMVGLIGLYDNFRAYNLIEK